MNHQIVQDALDNAAGADDETLTGAGMAITNSFRSGPTSRRISGAREVIKRFLEDLPSEMTAAEILEELR